MDAYRAVISLHNLGYQLKALDGDQVAIRPEVQEEHAEQIMAIRRNPQAACMAIQHLPFLCVAIMPGKLKEYAADVFTAMQEEGYAHVLKIIYATATGETEWVYVPTHAIARSTMMEILGLDWGVIYFECQEEGQRWGT